MFVEVEFMKVVLHICEKEAIDFDDFMDGACQEQSRGEMADLFREVASLARK